MLYIYICIVPNDFWIPKVYFALVSGHLRLTCQNPLLLMNPSGPFHHNFPVKFPREIPRKSHQNHFPQGLHIKNGHRKFVDFSHYKWWCSMVFSHEITMKSPWNPHFCHEITTCWPFRTPNKNPGFSPRRPNVLGRQRGRRLGARHLAGWLVEGTARRTEQRPPVDWC